MGDELLPATPAGDARPSEVPWTNPLSCAHSFYDELMRDVRAMPSTALNELRSVPTTALNELRAVRTTALNELRAAPLATLQSLGQQYGRLPTTHLLPDDGRVSLDFSADLYGRTTHVESTNPYGIMSLDVQPAAGRNGNQFGDYGYNFLAATHDGTTRLQLQNDRPTGVPLINFTSQFDSVLGASQFDYQRTPGVHWATFNASNDLFTTAARHDFLTRNSNLRVLSTPDNPIQFGLRLDAAGVGAGRPDIRYQLVAQTPDESTRVSLWSLNQYPGPGISFQTHLGGSSDTSFNYYRDERAHRATVNADFNYFNVGGGHDFRTRTTLFNLGTSITNPWQVGIGAGFGPGATEGHIFLRYGSPGD